MTFIVDYRCGGMGNNIVSHVLYACNQIDIDFQSFVSASGDAHALRKYYSSIGLIPHHVEEQIDDLPPNSEIILEIKTTKWYMFLQEKMSYAKFLRSFPASDNYKNFLKLNIEDQVIDLDDEWKKFYTAVKDSTWPESNRYADRWLLSQEIQNEINDLFKLPKNTVDDDNFLSLLTITYYDLLKKNSPQKSKYGGKIFLLDNYLSNNLDALIETVTEKLGWQWNADKSFEYYRYMISKNQIYLDWLNKIKFLHDITVQLKYQQDNLQAWEIAIIIAALADSCQFHPAELPWDLIPNNKFDNQSIVNFLKDKI